MGRLTERLQWIGREATGAMGTVAILAMLVILQWTTPMMPVAGWTGFVRDAVAQARGQTPIWWIELRQAHNGYYQALMTRGNDRTTGERSLLSRLWTFEKPEVYQDHPFRLTTGLPNLNVLDPTEGPQVTNSQGLFDDKEHAFIPTPGVRRVAMLGDSLTRGWGVAPDLNYPRLMENKLNGDVPDKTGKHFEFINFSVSGYWATQIYDVAREVAPKYKPDVYVMTLTVLAAGPEWASHLIELVQGRKDLRYDFLRDVVKASGVQAEDAFATAKRKLAPYHKVVLRGILQEIKSQAERESAGFLVALVPAVEDPEMVRLRFATARTALDGLNIPVVDLLDSYNGVPDIEKLRIYWYDGHPNAEGHRRVAENFLSKAKAQPEVWRMLTGEDVVR